MGGDGEENGLWPRALSGNAKITIMMMMMMMMMMIIIIAMTISDSNNSNNTVSNNNHPIITHHIITITIVTNSITDSIAVAVFVGQTIVVTHRRREPTSSVVSGRAPRRPSPFR